MKKAITILSLLTFIGCSHLKPEHISITEYSALGDLLSKQNKLTASQLKKEVALDGIQETKTLKMDTALWKDELSFLVEIDPNRPEYVGAFNESKTGNQTTLTLKPEEKGSLKQIVYRTTKGEITSVNAITHEDKDVYVHHQSITTEFKDEKLISYSINGYQKILMKDTVFFRLKGVVID